MNDYKWKLVIDKGGVGSGNYGHSGRPGLVGGSGPGGGIVSREVLHENLAQLSKLGWETEMEWASSFDSSGEHLWTGPGARGNESPIADGAAVAVHNHLSGLSFSAGDFASLITSPTLREIYVVAPSGKIYIAKKPADFRLKWGFEAGRRTIQGMLDDSIRGARGENAIDRYSNAIREVAEELGLEYSTDILS